MSTTEAHCETYIGTMRYKHETREVTARVANCQYAPDELKKLAALSYGWPLYDITLVHWRRVLTPEQVKEQEREVVKEFDGGE